MSIKIKMEPEDRAALKSLWKRYGAWELIRHIGRWAESEPTEPSAEDKPKHRDLFEAVSEIWGLATETDQQKRRVGALAREFFGKGATRQSIEQAMAAYNTVFPGCPCTPDAVCKHFEILTKDVSKAHLGNPNSAEYQLRSRGVKCTPELVSDCESIPMSDLIEILETHRDANSIFRSIECHDKHGRGNSIDRNNAPQSGLHSCGERLYRPPPSVNDGRPSGSV